MRQQERGVTYVIPDDASHMKEATTEQLFNEVDQKIKELLWRLFGSVTSTCRIYDLSPGEEAHRVEKELLKMWAVQDAIWELRRRTHE